MKEKKKEKTPVHKTEQHGKLVKQLSYQEKIL